jgi:hypothetical protein
MVPTSDHISGDVIDVTDAIQILANTPPERVACWAFRNVATYLQAPGPALSTFDSPSDVVETADW